MYKFNTGDRVVVVSTVYGMKELQPGNKATIRAHYFGEDDEAMFGVEMDNGMRALNVFDDDDGYWAFAADELEKIDE